MKPLYRILLAVITAIILNTPLFSQEITSNTVDGFTSQRTIETSMVSIKEAFSNGFGLSYAAVGKVFLLNVIGYGRKDDIISEDDEIAFLLMDGSIVKVASPIESKGQSSLQNVYFHRYLITLEKIELLKNKEVGFIRVISGQKGTNIKLTRRNRKELLKLSEIFLNEVSRSY